MRILLTTTSYQDTPGPHHAQLGAAGFEVVRARGPLDAEALLGLCDEHGGFDGLLHGDDALTARVIDALCDAPTRLRVLSKYGIGLDRVDVGHARGRGVPVLFTPGVNHDAVAEHAMGLMLMAARHTGYHLAATGAGRWDRRTGVELHGKTLGVVGLGRIGVEVARRARAFGMRVQGFGHHWPDEADALGVTRCGTVDELLRSSDVVSLHTRLTDTTRGLIDAAAIATMRDGAIVVNTARGGLVDEAAVADACRGGRLHGYATDVLVDEPMTRPHVFDGVENVVVTPHVGSRTRESVARQATQATTNLIEFLTGGTDYIEATT